MTERRMRAPEATMARAKVLRRTLTPPEARIWLLLKGRKLGGLQWRKQHPVGPYVLDFFCASAQLCLEIDGASHEFSMERDSRRDAWLAHRGIETLRVPAEAVRLTPEAKAIPDALRLEVRHQACNDRACLAPARLTVPVALTGGRE